MLCGNCKHRDKNGFCCNEKLRDYMEDEAFGAKDCLIYTSCNGAFKVGKSFGCVHWKEKPVRVEDSPMMTAGKVDKFIQDVFGDPGVSMKCVSFGNDIITIDLKRE